MQAVQPTCSLRLWAQIFCLVVEELRLLEFADALAQLEHRADQGGVVGGVEVALRRLVQGDQRRRRQVEHEVERLALLTRGTLEIDRAGRLADAHAVAVRAAAGQVDLVAEIDRLLGAGADARVAARAQVEVDRVRARPADLEGAEPARDPRRHAGVDGDRALLRQPAAAGARQEDADVETVAEQACRRERALGRADDENLAGRAIGDGRDRLGIGKLRRGDQRRDLRARARRVLRPAAALADVDEPDRPLGDAGRTLGLLGELEEEPAFLRAGDEQIAGALGGALEGAGLAPAQRRVDRSRPAPASGPSARASAGPSSGIVLLQSQIRVVIGAGRDTSGVALGGSGSHCATAAGAPPSGPACPAALARSARPARSPSFSPSFSLSLSLVAVEQAEAG